MEKYSKFNAVKLGISCGIISAIFVAFTTILALLGINYSTTIQFLTEIYGPFGYSVTGIGIILGAIYAFVDGFIATWIFALIYNKLI